jgi:hypothetical protein
MKKPSSIFLFWIILVVGGVTVTACYVRFQHPGSIPASSGSGQVSDMDKLYIEQMMDQTKWLESLAYATLVGMIVLKLKNPKMMGSRSYSAAASLLIVSIYGGFLGHDVILIALTKGLPLLYTNLGTLPYVTQFWSLLIALALLAKEILLPTRKIAYVLIGAIFLGVIGFMWPVPANAQHATQPNDPVPSCAASWAHSRFSVTPSADDLTTISKFVSLLASRSTVSGPTAQTCDFVDSTMDQVRYASSVIAGQDDYDDTTVLVKSLVSQLVSNAAAPGTFLGTLVQDLQIWRGRPTGSILFQTSRQGVTIWLDGNVIGLAPLLYIAVPGPHSVDVHFGGTTIFQKAITVIANVETTEVIP